MNKKLVFLTKENQQFAKTMQAGTFIRPVGRYKYCLEVLRVVETNNGWNQWQCKRWGMDKNKQPFRDKHANMHYLNDLKFVAPGVFKDECRPWEFIALYYRVIKTKGQLNLF